MLAQIEQSLRRCNCSAASGKMPPLPCAERELPFDRALPWPRSDLTKVRAPPALPGGVWVSPMLDAVAGFSLKAAHRIQLKGLQYAVSFKGGTARFCCRNQIITKKKQASACHSAYGPTTRPNSRR